MNTASDQNMRSIVAGTELLNNEGIPFCKGLTMTELKPTGQLVIQIVAMPADTNANGDIFGGWLVSHMDMGAAIAARQRARSRVVTAAIDALSFLNPVYVGDTVGCYADVMRVGRTSMQIKIEVWTVSIPDREQHKVAEGLFTFVAIDEQRKPHAVDRS